MNPHNLEWIILYAVMLMAIVGMMIWLYWL